MIFKLDVPLVPFVEAIVRLLMFEVREGVILESCLGANDLKALKARIARSTAAAAVLNEIVDLSCGSTDDLFSFSDIREPSMARKAILIPSVCELEMIRAQSLAVLQR